MEKIIIRNVTIDDFEVIYGFINELESCIFDKATQRQLFIENISNSNNIYLVALSGKNINGFISCHIQNLLHHGGPVGEIQELFVAPSKRSLGIGKKLVDSVKSTAA